MKKVVPVLVPLLLIAVSIGVAGHVTSTQTADAGGQFIQLLKQGQIIQLRSLSPSCGYKIEILSPNTDEIDAKTLAMSADEIEKRHEDILKTLTQPQEQSKLTRDEFKTLRKELKRESKKIKLYNSSHEVWTIGRDYVGIRRANTEIFIPLSLVRTITRHVN